MILEHEATSVPAKPIMQALDEWRELHGYSWADIARQCDIDAGTLSNAKSKSKYLKIGLVYRLGARLQIPREFLFKYTDTINLLLCKCPLEVLELFTSEEGQEALREAIREFGGESSDIGTIEYDYGN